MTDKATIGLDYSHNNKLKLEVSSYSEFTDFLFNSGYKLGKIEAGIDTIKKLETYDAILLSSPNNVKLTESEIDIIEKYVKKGGNLLIVSSLGGDFTNRTNLNQLTKKFGFEFEFDEIHDSVNYVFLQKRPLITHITPHIITERVKKLVFSSCCSIKVLDFIIDDKSIKIDTLARASINSWRRRYDGKEWVQEDCPKAPLIVSVECYEGKVVAFGSMSMFSSLGHEYGFSAFDNDIFLANVFRWLTSGVISSGKTLTVNLNLNLFYWAKQILSDQNWENISDIINVSVKYFKDNYSEAIEKIKYKQEEKVKRKEEYEKSKKDLEEERILDMVPIRKKEDLEQIMSALEELTGEKYKISIDLDKDDSKMKYAEEDIDVFSKETSKQALRYGKPTKAFKEWLEQKKKM
jgi:hypothetical protein